MPEPTFDPTPFLVQDEGQHFDRRSLFAGPNGRKRVRDRREVRDQIAKVVASFANAEGGVLILGLEDDGSLTGHRYPPDAIAAMLAVPRARLLPAQSEGFVVDHGGTALLISDVPAADSPVQVTGDGFPLRIGDQTVQASESQIMALKLQSFAGAGRAAPLFFNGAASTPPCSIALARAPATSLGPMRSTCSSASSQISGVATWSFVAPLSCSSPKTAQTTPTPGCGSSVSSGPSVALDPSTTSKSAPASRGRSLLSSTRPSPPSAGSSGGRPAWWATASERCPSTPSSRERRL